MRMCAGLVLCMRIQVVMLLCPVCGAVVPGLSCFLPGLPCFVPSLSCYLASFMWLLCLWVALLCLTCRAVCVSVAIMCLDGCSEMRCASFAWSVLPWCASLAAVHGALVWPLSVLLLRLVC